jgi:alginate production protein
MKSFRTRLSAGAFLVSVASNAPAAMAYIEHELDGIEHPSMDAVANVAGYPAPSLNPPAAGASERVQGAVGEAERAIPVPLAHDRERAAAPLDPIVPLEAPIAPLRDPPASTTQDAADSRLAQFQLPPTLPEIGAPPRPAVQRLTVQYAWGSESEIDYRRDRDLDRRNPDSQLILVPQLNGIIVYRPIDWLETTLEMILDKEIPVNEKHRVLLPSGEIQVAPKRRASFLVDQAFFRIHNVTAPFEFSVGRKNYEDERHWLYDTSMDIVSAGLRYGRLRADATVGREVYKDLDFAPSKREVKDRIDTYMLYGDYRFEDMRVGAYTVIRDDRSLREGRSRLMGVRALGSPVDQLSYWADLAMLRGTDESSRKLEGYGFDVGFTYRFTSVPHIPNVTLGYAFGTGDGNPNDQKNREFRQTGLHTNEIRMGGVPKFKVYGEAFDPDLSNIRIFTAGVGFQPAPNVSVELVYHRYRLHRISDQFRASALTAEINQIDGVFSKDMGHGLDVVVGFRRLFGLRLGLDLRAGVYFPGDAYRTEENVAGRPVIRHGDNAYAFVAKIWW